MDQEQGMLDISIRTIAGIIESAKKEQGGILGAPKRSHLELFIQTLEEWNSVLQSSSLASSLYPP